MTKVAVFIDGGHLRACAKSKKPYAGPGGQNRQGVRQAGETLFRILYYDCEEFAGSVKLPVSGGMKSYAGATRSCRIWRVRSWSQYGAAF